MMGHKNAAALLRNRFRGAFGLSQCAYSKSAFLDCEARLAVGTFDARLLLVSIDTEDASEEDSISYSTFWTWT